MTTLLQRALIGAISILCMLSSQAQAATLYVKHDATGNNDGSSWADAYADLQMGLTNALSGDEIWVAAGIYKPTTGTDRRATFQLKNGVALYGGFTGTETARAERDWETHPTVLSGDIDNNDTTDANGIVTTISGNNAYTVVTGSGTDDTAILEGFVITGGLANGIGLDGYGGGMYNVFGSPTLTNVTFSRNTASGGGGMSNISSSPTLTHVTFSSNTATRYGGGMQNSSSSPTLTHVTFSSNTATSHGGGMYNSDSSNPILTNVTFSNNTASGNGGGMYNNSSSSPTLTNVTFRSNTANLGGGMLNNSSSSPTLTDVTFSSNTATNYGGGMSNEYSSPTLSNVTFSSNTATDFGGGMLNDSSSPTLTDATFSSNTATNGGGMLNNSSSPTLTDVTFSSNTASENGGGMYNNSSSGPTLTDVTFSSNTASENGGGMLNNYSSNPKLINVIFYNNSALSSGGGIANFGASSPTLTNVTLSGNVAQQYSGGVYNQESESILKNVIVWGNTAKSGSPQISNSSTGKLNISYSLIQGGCSSITGATCGNGNRNDNPLFVDEPNGDLRLSRYSPAIDVGDKEAVTFIATDIAGNARIFNDEVDMGAYEYDGSGLGLKPTLALFVERSSTNPLNGIDVGKYSTPTLADIDNDGDLDAIIGEQDNVINYYENTGAAGFIEKTGATNPFSGVSAGGY